MCPWVPGRVWPWPNPRLPWASRPGWVGVWVDVVRGGILEVTRTLPRRNQSKAIHSTHFQSQLLPSANCGNPGKALELSESVISPQKAGAWFLAKACRKCVSWTVCIPQNCSVILGAHPVSPVRVIHWWGSFTGEGHLWWLESKKIKHLWNNKESTNTLTASAD